MKKTLVVCLLVLACVASVFAFSNDFVRVTFSPYALDVYHGQVASNYGLEVRVAYGHNVSIGGKDVVVGVELSGVKLFGKESVDINVVGGMVFASMNMPISSADYAIKFTPAVRLGLGTSLCLYREKETRQLVAKHSVANIDLAVMGHEQVEEESFIDSIGFGLSSDFAIWQEDGKLDFSTIIAPFFGVGKLIDCGN